MSGLLRSLAIAAVSTGMLAMAAPSADAGNKYRYRSNSGANYAAGLATGLIIGGIISRNRGYRRNYRRNNCYNGYCGSRHYYNRGYNRLYNRGTSLGPAYPTMNHQRYFGSPPGYRYAPRYRNFNRNGR